MDFWRTPYDTPILYVGQGSLAETAYLAAALAEFPIRCFTLCGQVFAGLWRRNGLSVRNQVGQCS